ncbi:MAG: flagellar motor switch protein FliM [Pirellulales bacterium]|nr:flagellar motor switch protein FliM [Pirellulales bacterium]
MSDENVLSQDEVQSLLSSLDGGAGAADSPEPSAPAPPPSAPAAPKPAAARPRERVTPYDFRRPERVGKEQMRALQSLHEGFGRNYGAALSALLRSIVEVKLTSVDQLTYSEFVFGLENPTCFNLIQADPLEGHFILDISPIVLYPVIDRLLGGGKESNTPSRRPLTEIELRIVGRITQLFTTELRKAWENVVELDLQVVRVESNPQLVQVVPPNEVVVLITFELAIGDVRGMFNLCIPFNSIERIGGKLSANSWTSYSRRAATQEDTQRTALNLHRATVEMVAELASTVISTGDLINLRIGDVITTDHDCQRPLLVRVEGVNRFLAKPGAFKGHKAILVDDVLDPPQDESSE